MRGAWRAPESSHDTMAPRQSSTDTERTARELRPHLYELAPEAGAYDPLLRLVGKSRFALLGEASHGTLEFYRECIRERAAPARCA